MHARSAGTRAAQRRAALVAFHEEGDHCSPTALSQRAISSGTPAVAVAVGGRRVLIGPITLPDGSSCGECGRRRVLAAAAGRAEPVDTVDRDDNMIDAAVDELIQDILDRGAHASPLVRHVLAIDLATGQSSLHRVVPMASCPVCGGAAASARAAPLSADDPIEVVFDELAGWVDPVTGVIPFVFAEPKGERDDGMPSVVTAAPPHVVGDDGEIRQMAIGWGKGFSLSSAVLSAVGEAIERYSASLPNPDRLVWARPEDLGGDRLDPRSFALYREDQYAEDGFPFHRFDAEAVHPWVEGRWLGDGKPVWVPAVLTYLALDVRAEQHIVQGTSNGLAAGPTYEAAAAAATMELVERDAFMATWLTGQPGRRVAAGAIAPGLQRVAGGIEAMGATAVELYLLPASAFGTTALCLSIGDGERWPGVAIGLAASLDPNAAIRQAVLELAQTGPHLGRMMRSGTLQAPAAPASVHEMIDHAAYYFPVERVTAFDSLRFGGEPITTLGPVELAPQHGGIKVALVDVTSRDVATGPFRVVRAVSADLQPVTYGYGFDRMPVPRVQAIGPSRAGQPIHPIW